MKISDIEGIGPANEAKLVAAGVGSEYPDLLEAAGVDSCPELAQRNATNLAVKLAETNLDKSLTRRVPTETMVADWIAQAKDLPKVVTH